MVNFDILAAILKKKRHHETIDGKQFKFKLSCIHFVQDNDQIWSKFALKWWNYNIYNILAAILKKSALTALSSIRIFAGTLVPIAMCIRFIKMVVSENPPGVHGGYGSP